MKGTLVLKDHQWKIQGPAGQDLSLHHADVRYKGEPLQHGMEVEFDIVPIEKRELREFAGSFKITTENVAKLK